MHHDDGDSFGSSAAFDGLFSFWFKLYAKVHNEWLGISLGTPEHYTVAIAYDVFMGVSILLIAYALYASVSYMYGPGVGGAGKAVFTAASLFFFMLTVGMLETQDGDFHWPLGFLDLPGAGSGGLEGGECFIEANTTI